MIDRLYIRIPPGSNHSKVEEEGKKRWIADDEPARDADITVVCMFNAKLHHMKKII